VQGNFSFGGMIQFAGPSGNKSPGPTFLPALLYIGEERFERAFAGIGAVWVVPNAAK
jgi:hypothetical protein